MQRVTQQRAATAEQQGDVLTRKADYAQSWCAASPATSIWTSRASAILWANPHEFFRNTWLQVQPIGSGADTRRGQCLGS